MSSFHRVIRFALCECVRCSDSFLSEGKPTGPIKGPAILVYYSPALMQKNAASDASGALAVLAEVASLETARLKHLGYSRDKT
eukprot:2789748-Amphidinium_carterae.3